MRSQILKLALALGFLAAPGFSQASDTLDGAPSYRDQVMAILQSSQSIKGEITAEMKALYSGREEDLVGLDDTMNSFEVNELVAEIIEAEAL